MNRWLFLLIIALLAGCSASTEPEPENSSFYTNAQELPDSFRYDEPPSMNFRLADTDGFSQGNVVYEQNGDIVWSIELGADDGTSVSKTWRPDPSEPGYGVVRWQGIDGHESIPQDFQGSKEIDILDTRYVKDGSISIEDIFTDEGVAGGHLTLLTPESLRKVATLDISDGIARIDYSDKVDADSLQAGLYRNLAEVPEYVTHSSMTQPDGIKLIPENWGNGNTYEDYVAHLRRFNVLPEELRDTGAIAVTSKWADGSSPIVGIYPNHVIDRCDDEEGYCAMSSDDENLLPSSVYIQASKEAYSQLNALVSSIDLDIRVQGESEQSLPEHIVPGDQDFIMVGGGPSFTYAITQFDTIEEGYFTFAAAMQRTDPPASNVSLFGTLADGIENLGPRTTGREYLTVDINRNELKPFAPKLLNVWHATPRYSGVFDKSDNPLPGATGAVSFIRDYRLE